MQPTYGQRFLELRAEVGTIEAKRILARETILNDIDKADSIEALRGALRELAERIL
jgi:hypothetical protein